MSKIVSIIIPLRITPGLHDAECRLVSILDTIPENLFNVIVVDFGSQKSGSESINLICSNRDFVKVVRTSNEYEKFSIGAARDFGAQCADTPVVLFHDIDFICDAGMYKSIYSEIISRNMDKNTYDFFCVPVIWLTEEGSKDIVDIVSNESDYFKYFFHNAVTEHNKSIFDFVAYGSSAIVVNKYNLLSIGGHNPRFYGHGAEDYDILHRLSANCQKGPRTGSYFTDTKDNSILKYEGFRSYFALYGIDVFNRGIFLVHMWHPRRSIPNYFQSKRNFKLLETVFAEFDRQGHQPPPLADLTANYRTLALMPPESRSAASLRYAAPYMGEVTFISENFFDNPDQLLAFAKEEGFDVVGLLNPYGNLHRLAIYKRLREAKFPYWTFDRGALPDSWFFDPNGFNADSASYSPAEWDNPLSDEEEAKVYEKIEQVRQSANTLEANGEPQTASYWRDRFNLGRRKVIFVPFQRPADTVIKYFSGTVDNMDNFVNWVNFLAENIDQTRWAVVVKKHPLENNISSLSNVYVAPDDAHVHDLIELSDKVLLINSGVGVISMMHSTPVIYCGDVFYDVPGCNYHARSANEALKLCNSELEFDLQHALRFLYHLYFNIYSFGTATYEKIKQANGSNLSLVKKIIFNEIRGIAKDPIMLGQPRKGVSLDAQLFYSFGSRAGINSSIKKPVEYPKVPLKTSINQLPNLYKGLQNKISGDGVVSSGPAVHWPYEAPMKLLGDAHWERGSRWNIFSDKFPIKMIPRTSVFQGGGGHIAILLHLLRNDADHAHLMINGNCVAGVNMGDGRALFKLEFNDYNEIVIESRYDDVFDLGMAIELTEVRAFDREFGAVGNLSNLIKMKKIIVRPVNASGIKVANDSIAVVELISLCDDPVIIDDDYEIVIAFKDMDGKTSNSIKSKISRSIFPGCNIVNIDIPSIYMTNDIKSIYTDICDASGGWVNCGRGVSLIR